MSPQDQIILITGASSFLASHVADYFLRAGYQVRGTVWSSTTAKKATLSIVGDIAKPGAFDPAVHGVHGVIHAALPFQVFGIEDNERDLLKPAINGMLNILKAPGHVYSKLDCNPTTYEAVAAKGAPAGLAYSTLKVVSERVAWDFVKNNELKSDLSRLNTLLSKSSDAVLENMFWSSMDMRDVAEAHLRAFEVPKSGGKRFFIYKGNFTYQQFMDALWENVPEIRDRVLVGVPGTGSVPANVYTINTSKSQRILGLKYQPLEETIVNAARSLLKLEEKSV
ncbi:hypothetical protein BJX65DRAFT_292360 [Aspergillus insuetus]